MITPLSANNSDTQRSPYESPQAPHTAPSPSIHAQPECAQTPFINSPSSDYQSLAYLPSSTTNSPHAAPPQYDSPNSNPQLGHVQLDFIPLPSTRPSAPPQSSTTIPIANGKHEAAPHYVAPPSPSSSATVPYPVPPSTCFPQQHHHENVTFVDATPIDMSKEKYKLSPAAGGSTILEDLRNPRKKAFWILNIIVLAIVFGVLGATVWKPDSSNNNSSPGNNDLSRSTSTSRSVSSTDSRSSTVAPTTPVPTPVIPTPVIVPTPVTVPSAPNPTPQPTSGGDKDAWAACRNVCTADKNKCDAVCANESGYQSCTAQCNGQSRCLFDCKMASGCFSSCSNAWGDCAQKCPSPLKK